MYRSRLMLSFLTNQMLPLRERMRVTREKYCWSCHEKMDPLGLPFEMYNHAGLYRTTEFEKPVDHQGKLLTQGTLPWMDQ